jgi:hypothetical protein
MTAQEKAIELVDNFYQRFPLTMDVITTRGDLSWEYDSWKEAKQCALIAVDELLNNFLSNKTTKYGRERYHFWQEVNQLITQL